MVYLSINLLFKKDPEQKNTNITENENKSESFSLELKNHRNIFKKGIPMFILEGFLENL